MTTFFQWLAAISVPLSGPGQPFQASWQYVAAALLAPAVIGLAGAVITTLLEKVLGLRMGGGGV